MNNGEVVLIVGVIVVLLAGFAAYSLGHRAPPDKGAAIDFGAVGNLISIAAKL
jgi:hypothetical protein